ncbi:hypothetical protein Bca52824_005901 [Brassica carinata]|uniref:Uncharacterized protein n=1 Tax=Brassica carinata TaxID=52824 RepID=A0A8X7WRN1_BRACI|nr:hypothetical protein Bca52824_005901 [Brassica carinata]
MSSARYAITRLGLARSLGESQVGASRSVGSVRCFSDDKGRVLSDEERAKETIYIQVLLHLKLIIYLLISVLEFLNALLLIWIQCLEMKSR